MRTSGTDAGSVPAPGLIEPADTPGLHCRGPNDVGCVPRDPLVPLVACMADPSPERKRRPSITKLQRQSAAGADLISLCQTVTADGRLADEEVSALNQWVEDHAAVDLPARDFLFTTIRRILADGKVTDDERTELYQAIETVLPPDVRADVRGRRRVVETAARAARRQQRQRTPVRKRQRTVGAWNFMVAGCRYEGRPSVIRDYAVPGDAVRLVRDSGNRFSRHATEVRLKNDAVAGYVPERFAVEMAPLLDQGFPYRADLTKVLTGGRTPIPVVQVRVFGQDGQVPSAFAAQVEQIVRTKGRIEAIRFVREQRGVSLADAKTAVDAVAGVPPPSQRQSQGCFSVLLLPQPG